MDKWGAPFGESRFESWRLVQRSRKRRMDGEDRAVRVSTEELAEELAGALLASEPEWTGASKAARGVRCVSPYDPESYVRALIDRVSCVSVLTIDIFQAASEGGSLPFTLLALPHGRGRGSFQRPFVEQVHIHTSEPHSSVVHAIRHCCTSEQRSACH